ncbi:surface carbohydrate biosynthesis protein [Methylopila sp. M107]|uniref:surface carbohydrate biosynthesis protein n=1 Tax=Methylopila sp. M107 TaxID=1101190 RepID=UPI000371C611|nr:surface carbohydrate biosynthesis protein [Methylopila sp. M107]
MAGERRFPVILPSETQHREFDAKLLLAGMLAERGHPVIVGSRMEIHNRIHRLPRGLYVAKDIFRSSRRMFQIMERLGFGIVAWDEEAIVVSDAKTYHARRVDSENLNQIKAFLAWGENNRRLIESAPGYHGTPVHETGNPRVDLLSDRVRGYFEPDVAALKAQYGDFILINSNFGRINHFLENERVRRLANGEFENLSAGTPEWWMFRIDVFNSFLAMLPAVARAFPDRKVVVRPHPSESHEVWLKAAEGLPNVEVVHEGNISPWLLASAVAIHNGCTTGLESYLLGHPVIAYRAVRSDGFDDRLPNHVSTSVFSQADLIETMARLFSGVPLPSPDPDALAKVEDQIGRRDGVLASERIDALIAEQGVGWLNGESSFAARIAGRISAMRRRAQKLKGANVAGHKNSAEYTAHRFQGLTAADARQRLARLGQGLDRFSSLDVRELYPNVFMVSR